MKEIEIYCNYGVLGAEKRNIYTFGAESSHGICSDKMTVLVPDDWKLYSSPTGMLMTEAPWGWNYDINEVLTDIQGHPAFQAFDKSGRPVTAFLYTREELEEKRKKENRKRERREKKERGMADVR